MIVRSDGVVVTNFHVVAGAVDVSVALAAGTPLLAVVEAADPLSDLVTLRVDREDLPAPELADGYPEIGELAVAVGSPLGFENTVTAGIVSGLDRANPRRIGRGPAATGRPHPDRRGHLPATPVEQSSTATDASSASTSPTCHRRPGAASLRFAIPTRTVRDVVEELLEDGTADHAYLGVRLLRDPSHTASGLLSSLRNVRPTALSRTDSTTTGVRPFQSLPVGAPSERY